MLCMKPMVLDWVLLSEVDSAVFVQMQPPLVIQNLHPCDSRFSHMKLHCVYSGQKKEKPNFSKRRGNIATRLLGILN